MAYAVSIDATSDDATNTQFDLEDEANGFRVLEADWDDPDDELIQASSADTEGERPVGYKPHNRTPMLKVKIAKSTAATLDTAVGQLQSKIGKLKREGGSIKVTTSGGNIGYLDVTGAQMALPDDHYYVKRNVAIVTLRFNCLPYVRGVEVQIATFSETSLPVAITTFTAPAGDAPALGRIALAETQGVDQWHVHWGVQSRYYDSGTTAALHYKAETCLPQGGAVVAALSGASGGTAVYQGTLTTSYQSMLSLASSGTVYKQHVGDFNLLARLYRPTSNTGEVSVAVEYAEGDFTRSASNDAVVYDADEREGDFTIASLGQVHLSKVKKGAQRWDGHIIAKSTVLGDDLYVDDWWLQPISESAGEVTAAQQFSTPTTISARDEFEQTAGNLNAKTLPVGGTWATSGDATDLVVDAGADTVTRATDADAANGRFAVASLTGFAGQLVQVDMSTDSGAGVMGWWGGIVARWTDIDNRLGVQVSTSGSVRVVKWVATASTVLATAPASTQIAGSWYTLRALVNTNGTFYVWFGPQGSDLGEPICSGSDAALATGGTLASGKVGFSDYNATDPPGSTHYTRSYDNFSAAAAISDAAVYASKLAEIRYDSYLRQDSAGTVWAAKTVEGDYFKIPPTGREARTARLLIKASRGDPSSMFDSGLDDIAGTVYAAPRYLRIPAP